MSKKNMSLIKIGYGLTVSVILVFCLYLIFVISAWSTVMDLTPTTKNEAEQIYYDLEAEFVYVLEHMSKSDENIISFNKENIRDYFGEEELYKALYRIFEYVDCYIKKVDNCIYVQLWGNKLRTTGIVYSINGDKPVSSGYIGVYITNLELLNEGSLYFYEASTHESYEILLHSYEFDILGMENDPNLYLDYKNQLDNDGMLYNVNDIYYNENELGNLMWAKALTSQGYTEKYMQRLIGMAGKDEWWDQKALKVGLSL